MYECLQKHFVRMTNRQTYYHKAQYKMNKRFYMSFFFVV